MKVLNLIWLLIIVSCNPSLSKQQPLIDKTFFDTAFNGEKISVYSQANHSVFLEITGRESKTYAIRELYTQFAIHANGIDLNYTIEKAGNNFYILNSITNDFSFLINGNNYSVVKVYKNPIIAIDTINARVFYNDFASNSVKLILEDLKSQKQHFIELKAISDSIFYHHELHECLFEADGRLHIKWTDTEGALRDTSISISPQ